MSPFSSLPKVQIPYGFTLIEIIVAVGIMLVLTGGALAGFANYNSSQRLKQAGRTLVTELRQAQRKAMSGQRALCSSNEAFGGYRVVMDPGRYTISTVCGSASRGPKTVNLPANIVLSSGTLTFMPLTGSISSPVTITLTQNTAAISLTVSTTGAITQNGF